jgi:hypothetical protein
VLYANATLPVLGTTLGMSVDATGHAGATFTMVAGFAGPVGGVSTSFGELLVDPTESQFTSVVLSSGVDTHSVAIPAVSALAGAASYTQAVVLGGTGPELANAIDYVLGF